MVVLVHRKITFELSEYNLHAAGLSDEARKVLFFLVHPAAVLVEGDGGEFAKKFVVGKKRQRQC